MFSSTFLPNIFLARFHFRFNRSSGTEDSNVILKKLFYFSIKVSLAIWIVLSHA